MSAGSNTKQLSGGGIRGLVIQGCAIGSGPPLTFGEPYIPVTGVSINAGTTLSIKRLTPTQVTATVTPSNATDPTLTWRTNNPSILNVKTNADNSATIIGIGSTGQCILYADSVDGVIGVKNVNITT